MTPISSKALSGIELAVKIYNTRNRSDFLPEMADYAQAQHSSFLTQPLVYQPYLSEKILSAMKHIEHNIRLYSCKKEYKWTYIGTRRKICKFKFSYVLPLQFVVLEMEQTQKYPWNLQEEQSAVKKIMLDTINILHFKHIIFTIYSSEGWTPQRYVPRVWSLKDRKECK